MQDADLQGIKQLLSEYDSVEKGCSFFRQLGYEVLDPPVSFSLEDLPQGATESIRDVYELVNVGRPSPFRVFHVQLEDGAIRRTPIRRFLEAFYRHHPQGENLFVFSSKDRFDELAFVSPVRIPDPRDSAKVRLWLRYLQVQRTDPYRTDQEVLSRIRADGIRDATKIWELHREAFSVQRVTKDFFKDYSKIFGLVAKHLTEMHPKKGSEWARSYAHQLLNRIMFIYFIARKGWLLGPDGGPDRNFMRNFWEAYREAKLASRRKRDTFHRDWLSVLFFEAFNNRWQNRAEYRKRFPDWLIKSLSQAPYLNGGLYTENREIDGSLQKYLSDEVFEYLFEKWTDNTPLGLFERYNFTVVESGRFDEEVAVDPEMLGMVYERLVNIAFEVGQEAEETDRRGEAGIFYTPRTEIDLMCRLSLVDWLSNQLGEKHKDLLYHWILAFSSDEKEEADERVTRQGMWRRLNDLLRRVRVSDPDVGSGSFLIGMMLVLDDLQARCNNALGEGETPYERRKRILRDQLYGVDVMEWAVRVAELRLWLQLVVETELRPAERRFKPLLPNLNFKLRYGDSLLQTVGDVDMSPFRRAKLPISRPLKGRLTKLQGKKRHFFQGETKGLSEEMLLKEELDLFRAILDERIHTLKKELKRVRQRLEDMKSQGDISEEISGSGRTARVARQVEEQIESYEEELQRFEETRRALRSDRPPPFVWDIAFVEIFESENPGFDIVIGNPPYVRQEKISDYLGRFDRREYLERLNDSLREIYPDFMGRRRRISGRADYYIYFYLHGLSLLADKGTFCFITSNSWLDVDFGKDLQEFLLCHCHSKMVIDNRARRSFAQADVNTVIVLLGQPDRKRRLGRKEMQSRHVRFVAFKVPFEEALSPVVYLEIEDKKAYRHMANFRVLKRPEFRSVLWDQWSLYREGLAEPEAWTEEEEGKYEGDKWGGKYLRAPDIYFTILEKGKGKLVRLGDIAEVRRGFTTGANEFFYLQPVDMTVKQVSEVAAKKPRTPVRVKNGAGWEGEIEAAWLRPVIKSPREIKTLQVRLEDLSNLIFIPPDGVRRVMDTSSRSGVLQCLKKQWPKAVAYIRWGERQGYQNRPTCASRPWWWDVGDPRIPTAIWFKAFNDRFFVPHNDVAPCSDRLYAIHCAQGPDAMAVSAAINYTAQTIIADACGRVNLGEGALDNMTYEAARNLVLNPPVIDPGQRRKLAQSFRALACCPVRSIFQELGFDLCPLSRCQDPEHPYEHVKPEELTLDQVKAASPDRFDLDSVVFDVLGLSDDERLEVYKAVAQLVKDRLVKARSV